MNPDPSIESAGEEKSTRGRPAAAAAASPSSASSPATPPVAYLVNAYPKVSHSFVRREIAALEALGQPILRVSIRPPEKLVDAEDLAEEKRTTVLLDRRTVVAAALRALLEPTSLFRALRAAGSMAGAAGGGLAGWCRHGVYLAEACRLRELLAGAGATHLHAHFGTNPAAVARLCRLLGGPTYSFTVHGPEEFDRPVQLSLAGKAADARFVACVSSFGRSQLMRWLDPAHWRRIAVVRCGLDAAYLGSRPEPEASAPAGSLLVCVGRLCEQKGQHLLIEALALLAHRGVDVRLRLVGDGPMRAELEAAAADRGVDDRVEFTGNASAEAVRAHLLEARAMVLPSFAEGLPVVLMEAMALRRPVITTFIAGIPELVDSDCGWVVPAGDVEGLARAMAEALLAEPAALAAKGEAGRRRVLESHDIDRIAADLLGRFSSDTANAPAARPFESVAPRATPAEAEPRGADWQVPA